MLEKDGTNARQADQEENIARSVNLLRQTLVLSRARSALELGFDGIISSGLEVPALRKDLGNELVILVPGIRPITNKQDHKRTVDVEEAFTNGADYIVVGRPIREHSDPRAKAEEIQARIASIIKKLASTGTN